MNSLKAQNTFKCLNIRGSYTFFYEVGSSVHCQGFTFSSHSVKSYTDIEMCRCYNSYPFVKIIIFILHKIFALIL